MVSVQIKMMMDQDEMDYVGNSIYLSNYKDNDDEEKIKIKYGKYTHQEHDDGSRLHGLCCELNLPW